MMEGQKIQRIDDLEFKRQIQQFTSNLQKGDLGLSEFIQFGYALYGQTRSGKTATGHLLSGNALKGNKIKGQDMVEVATSKNRKAIIGNTMNSQTVIPNFFEVKLFQKQSQQEKNHNQSMRPSFSQQQSTKAYVIDTPGYGDTYGVLRILANGYFHYRMYSRVKNMKFILCFDSNQLKNTANKFINTILQFSSYFKDYLQKKQQIWQSCAFLFTKVEQSENKLQDLYEKLEAIAGSIKTQLNRNVQNGIKQFIRFIVRQKRVFCIKRFRKGESCSTGHLLRQIDSAIPQWWSRSMNIQKNEVDMQPILFSVAKQIMIATTQSDISQRQFAQLTRYYNIRINQIVKQGVNKNLKETVQSGLSYVLNELVKDSLGSPQDRNFLNVMQSYIKKYYQHFDPAYKEDRQKLQKHSFYQNPSSLQEKQKSSQKKFYFKDKNYLVKKFKVLKQIEQLKQQINIIEFQDRNLDWLEKCQTYLYQMIGSLSKISYKKHNTTQIVYKYGYLIHRIVEEAKMFLLLTKLSTTPDGQKRLKQAADNEFIDLMRQLKDFMGLPYIFDQQQVNYEELHMKFIKQFMIQDEKYKKLQINQGLIDFFCENDNPDQEDSQKIVQLILKYSEIYLQLGQERPSIATKSTQNLLIRLLNARSNCQSAYYLRPDEEHQTHQIFLIRRTTQQLGKLLQCLKKYDLARKVYKTVKYVDSVCRLYQLQLQSLKSISKNYNKNNPSSQRQFKLRLEFAEYLANHFRQQEAVKILQQTFQSAKNISQLSIVKDQLSELKLRMNDINSKNDYAQKLFNGEYFENMGQDLQDQIGKVVQYNNAVDI